MAGCGKLAAAFGQGAGGVRAAGRISSAAAVPRGGSAEVADARRRVRCGGHEAVWQGGEPLTPQALLAGGIGIAASIDDLRRRQISNWIPLAAFASGLALQT